MTPSLTCTPRETLAHEILQVITGLDAEAARYLLGDEQTRARLSEEIERQRLYRALEHDHEGLDCRRLRAWKSLQLVIYGFPGAEELLSGDGPAVAELVEEWLVRVGERNGQQAERLRGLAVDAEAEAVDLMEANRGVSARASATLDRLRYRALRCAEGHRAAAHALEQAEAHWRAKWAEGRL